MVRRGILAVFLALLPIGATLAGCRPDPNAQFIQGGWFFEDPHLRGIVGESHLESEWFFERGTFEHRACCFVEVYEYGRYSVLESTDAGLVLELYDLRGHAGGMVISRGETRRLTIDVDREADTLEIGRDGPYVRSLP